jgi:hypothetical protein
MICAVGEACRRGKSADQGGDTARSGQDSRGRPTWRRSTATSGRSTQQLGGHRGLARVGWMYHPRRRSIRPPAGPAVLWETNGRDRHRGAVTQRDGAPMVLGCTASDEHGTDRTGTRTGSHPSLISPVGFRHPHQAHRPAITSQHRTARTAAKRYARTDSLQIVKSICLVRTTDQKVGGSSPFGRAINQGRDQGKRGSRPSLCPTNEPYFP